jgi:hypothetical protein
MAQQHDFVSISIVPVEARLDEDGEAVYTPTPEKQLDNSPEQVCQHCYTPLTKWSINAECPGPAIPDDISSLVGGDVIDRSPE